MIIQPRIMSFSSGQHSRYGRQEKREKQVSTFVIIAFLHFAAFKIGPITTTDVSMVLLAVLATLKGRIHSISAIFFLLILAQFVSDILSPTTISTGELITRTFRYEMQTILLCVVFLQLSPRKNVKNLIGLFQLSAVFVVFAIITANALNQSPKLLPGVASLSQVVAILGAVLIANFKKNVDAFIASSLVIVALYFSDVRSSILIYVVFFSFLLISNRLYLIPKWLVAAIAASILCLVVILVSKNYQFGEAILYSNYLSSWIATEGISAEEIKISSDINRLNYWTMGIGYFWERPFIGYGTSGFSTYNDYLSVHHDFLQILLDGGLIKFFLYLVLVGKCVFMSQRNRTASTIAAAHLGGMILFGYGGGLELTLLLIYATSSTSHANPFIYYRSMGKTR